jgi:hypothetical protein
VVGTFAVLPVVAHAQEANLSGTVTDTTGGALPGVTVRAIHQASGNSFETVTDERGAYRLPVRVGVYQLTAELSGFTPITRTLTLLVGQQAVVNLQMSVGGLQESVTVTGEAPLLDVTQSSLGGNIDSRQVQELPVQGRNWLDLAMLVPGSRVNDSSSLPSEGGQVSRAGSDYQLNVDGQQVTVNFRGTSDGNPPKFSRDAIAEFVMLTSRFDATQGRSSGVQVMAVTKSGTNTPSGTFAGYFRHDRFNAADPVAKRVLPYQNQQLSGTVGGPVRRDRVHFFANYEYEREPGTAVWTTPFSEYNLTRDSSANSHIAGGRLDAQFSQSARFAFRGNSWSSTQEWGGGSAESTPSAGATGNESVRGQYLATLTNVLSNQTVNELKVGFTNHRLDGRLLNDQVRGPEILLRGFTLGGPRDPENWETQSYYALRNDFTYSSGPHTWKLGAEYLRAETESFRCEFCEGQLTADLGPIPANLGSIVPDQFNAASWNLRTLSPISRQWTQRIQTPGFKADIPRNIIGGWVQNDWTATRRLTMNLGLRYDVEFNAFYNDKAMLPWVPSGRPDDTNNVAPRLGFSFSQDDRTVIRGGYGVYFGTMTQAHYLAYYADALTITLRNDGRPDFASNPWNGPTPTFEQASAFLCTPALEAGCLRPEAPRGGVVPADGLKMPYSHQASIGFQRQIGASSALEADYVYQGRRDDPRDQFVNLNFNPATGANFPFRDRPHPEWGQVSLTVNGYRANYHALQTGFTKRMSASWQASGTYTLSVLRDADPKYQQWNRDLERLEAVPFALAPDFGGEYTLAIGDQRHRTVLNGIWDVGRGLQLSGIFFAASGIRLNTRYGVDLRDIGGTRPFQHRLRPDGTMVPRNDFVGKPVHRLNLRIRQRISLSSRVRVDGLLEVFNLYNRANFQNYVGTDANSRASNGEVSRNYLQPAQSTNIAYAPRTLQLGFWLSF